jgi:hypothetical protein
MTLELGYPPALTIAPGSQNTAQPRYGSSEAEIAEMARSIPRGGLRSVNSRK